MSDSPDTDSEQGSEPNPPADIDETGQPSLGTPGSDADADDSAGDEVAPDSITDDQLPEDLRPGDDNPLARPLPEDEGKDVDLGDRQVELIHPGRGHTAGDLVVRVPDADVLAAGDLVEQSDPPFIGGDSWPFEWPTTMDLVLGFLGDATVVVPGHGKLVDKEFVQDQRTELGVIAETIRDLAGRGVPLEAALATGEWPWPTPSLEHAVRVGYEQLPRSQKRLPLI